MIGRSRTALASALVACALAACGGTERGAMSLTRDDAERDAAQLTGGSPGHGPAAMRQYGCGTCHTIPGVRGAAGKVGPPLAGVASRAYLAGVLPNTPNNMVRWIRDPQGVDPLTAMPKTGVTVADARDIAAYLYTLK